MRGCCCRIWEICIGRRWSVMMYDCIWDWTAYTSIGERFSIVFFCTAIQSLRVRIPAVRRETATVSIRPLVQIVFLEILTRATAVDIIIEKQLALQLDGVSCRHRCRCGECNLTHRMEACFNGYPTLVDKNRSSVYSEQFRQCVFMRSIASGRKLLYLSSQCSQ